MGYCGVCKRSKFFTKMFDVNTCKECYKSSNIKTINDLKSELYELKEEKAQLLSKIDSLNALNKEGNANKELQIRPEPKESRKEPAPIIVQGKSKKEIKNNTYVAIDVETTGLFPERDELIEIAAIKVINGEIVDTFQRLIKPSSPIPRRITQLTGITNEMVEFAVDVQTVLLTLYLFIDNFVLMGHNIARFDIKFLNANYVKHLGYPMCNDYFDTLTFSRKVIPELENHRLETVSEYLEVSNKEAHRALSDCHTTHACYQKLIKIKNNESINAVTNS